MNLLLVAIGIFFVAFAFGALLNPPENTKTAPHNGRSQTVMNVSV
jgi:hypothetical protein